MLMIDFLREHDLVVCSMSVKVANGGTLIATRILSTWIDGKPYLVYGRDHIDSLENLRDHICGKNIEHVVDGTEKVINVPSELSI